ncbi:MAG: NAD-dependent epimerase/dehydratase family protein [Planctomycetota bacterium]
MRALVTGGSGFLGSALVRRLLADGHEVRSFARHPASELAALGADIRSGDIRDAAQVAEAVRGCDVVFHAAAKTGIWGRRSDFLRTNATGTVNVIAACFRHRVQKLIYTSSPSVVAHGGDLEGVDESTPYPDDYTSDYPETKARAERMVIASNENVLPTVALRPHLIWGPGDNHLVPRLLARARAGRLRLVGDGRNRVDSVYIDNAVDAHLLAAEHLAAGSRVAGKVYFISNAEPLAIADLINRILASGGLPPVSRSITFERAFRLGKFCERLYGFLRIRREPLMTRFLAQQLASAHWFDIGAAERDFGYRPRVSIAEGMQRLAASLRPVPSGGSA